MTDEATEESQSALAEVVDPLDILDNPLLENKEIQDKIHNAARRIILLDKRLGHDPETLDAIKDWIRAEVMLDKMFRECMDPTKVNASKERMFRTCLNEKNKLRDEIWEKALDQKGRDLVVSEAKMVLEEDQIIEAQVKVDPLD